MKVFLDYKLNDSGKGKFLQRLIPALERIGVKIVDKNYDIVLGVNRWRNKFNCPKILRIDGVHFWDNDKSNWKNDRVLKSMKQADAILWQSEFSKRMVSGLFSFKAKKEVIIFNGADPKDYNIEPLKSPYKYNILISGRFKSRRHKRFKEMSRIAYKYVQSNPDACFWIAGKFDIQYVSHERIKHLSYVEESKLRQIIRSCDVMLNLAWFDWCPNAVIEAMVAGVPVICSNGTGVEEIVGKNGTVLNLDKRLEPVRIAKNRPPEIDEKPVLDALDYHYKNKIIPDISKIHIDVIAKKYKEAFEYVLS